MNRIDWTKDGEKKKIRLKLRLQDEWRDIGDLVGLSAQLNGYFTKNLGDVSKCITDVFNVWINRMCEKVCM